MSLWLVAIRALTPDGASMSNFGQADAAGYTEGGMIDSTRLLQRAFPVVRQQFSARDTIVYALGVGVGLGERDDSYLRFVHEDSLYALPSMITVLCWPGLWERQPDTGIDWRRVLHVGERFSIPTAVPVQGVVEARTRVTSVVDKGPEKGVLIATERTVCDVPSGKPLGTVTTTLLCRSERAMQHSVVRKVPGERTNVRRDWRPDKRLELSTSSQTNLIYRLCGDLNPLHVLPSAARLAGYQRPILHGLCTFGIACRAVMLAYCGAGQHRIAQFDMRFTAPVFPGDRIRVSMRRTTDSVSFRCATTGAPTADVGSGTAKLANGVGLTMKVPT